VLWIVITLAASAAQTWRNAAQRGLTDRVGPLAATHARFLYGLPFAVLFYTGLAFGFGEPVVLPAMETIGWAALGGVAQICATALLLAAMQSSAFVVAVAYSKTEPLLVLGAAWLIVGDVPTPLQSGGIVLATLAVLLLSQPGRTVSRAMLVPLLFGVGSGALFAVSAVCYRAGIVSLDPAASFVMRASTTLVIALSLQTVMFSLWLRRYRPSAWRGLLENPVAALPAGFAGAGASQLWFMAFALAGAPMVRTLALVEVLFSYAVTGRLFAESLAIRQRVGLVALCVGLAALLLGA
jgi:drug/metabolite transporter (DMT)-like permease